MICAREGCGGIVIPKTIKGGRPKSFCSDRCASIAYNARWADRRRNPEAWRVCAFDGCGHRIRVDNESGYCARHFMWVRNLRVGFGLEPSHKVELLRSQGGACAVCGANRAGGKTGAWHIDHDHVPGYEQMSREEKRRHVRGLLCHACNTALTTHLIANWPSASAYLFDDHTPPEVGAECAFGDIG